MMKLTRLRALLVATQIALLACGDGTGPAPIQGTYALRRVEGRLGPPFITSDLSCAPGERSVSEITGDTITLSSSGAVRHASYRQRRVWRDGVEGTPLTASTIRTGGTYRRDGGLVIITYPSIPQQPPPPVDTFRISTLGLERDGGLGGVCDSGPTDARIGKFEYARL